MYMNKIHPLWTRSLLKNGWIDVDKTNLNNQAFKNQVKSQLQCINSGLLFFITAMFFHYARWKWSKSWYHCVWDTTLWQRHCQVQKFLGKLAFEILRWLKILERSEKRLISGILHVLQFDTRLETLKNCCIILYKASKITCHTAEPLEARTARSF